MNITFKLAIIIVLINGDLKLLLRSILHKFGKLSMKGKMETHDYYKKTNALLHASLPELQFSIFPRCHHRSTLL